MLRRYIQYEVSSSPSCSITIFYDISNEMSSHIGDEHTYIIYAIIMVIWFVTTNFYLTFFRSSESREDYFVLTWWLIEIMMTHFLHLLNECSIPYGNRPFQVLWFKNHPSVPYLHIFWKLGSLFTNHSEYYTGFLWHSFL